MIRTKNELVQNIKHLAAMKALMLEELTEADHILRMIGFKEGLKTVKEAAKGILIIKGKL